MGDFPALEVPDSSDATSFVEVSSSEGSIASAVEQIAEVTETFNAEVKAIIESMLDVVVTFNQETNTYVLTDPDAAASYEIVAPTFEATATDVADADWDGSLPDLDFPDIVIGEVPDLSIDIPAFSIPTPPDVDIPAFNATMPDITMPDLPSRPSYTLPVMPQLSSLTIPEPPSYDIPDFSGEIPYMDLTPPDHTFSWSEAGYSSQLKTQLEGKLVTDIADGDTTGIEASVQAAMFARARARQLTVNEQFNTDIINFFSSRGLTVPPAVLASAQVEVDNRNEQTDTNLDNDITILTAKLAQEHKPVVLDTSINWEQALVAYHDEAQDRALAAAKAVTEVMLEVYQAKIVGYRGQTEIYRSMAEVYQARVSAELAKAEFYKAQIEGKKMTIEAQRAMVEAYTAQVDGVNILAKMYATEMEAAKIQAEIDTERMRSYVELVKAYAARIEALAAQYKLYIARIEGERAKVKMYEAQVEAFEAQVQAHIARVMVDIAHLKIQIEQVKAQAERYAAQVQKYAADVDKALGQADVGVIGHRVSNTNHDAQVRNQANSMDYQGKVANSDAQERATRETVDARIKAAANKALAELQRITAMTQAVYTRSQARQAASQIARHSKSENWSDTDSQNDSTTVRVTKSINMRSSDVVQVGRYFHTHHNS